MDREPDVTTEQQSALEELHEAILAYDKDAARTAARKVVDSGVDPEFALARALARAAKAAGDKLDEGEYYLPHLVMACNAMMEAAAVLESAMPKERIQAKKVVVIGTVQADIHTVGKNVVAMMLRANGFEVHDLGVDVKSTAFVRKAREVGADIIALSSLLTTTMPYQREVIEDLEAVGLRERFKVMVGGGPVTRDWAIEIGADGYGADAAEAVATAKKLVAEPVAAQR